MELYAMTAAELAKKLRAKECSALEITRSVLARVRAVEGQIGAYVTVTDALAEEQARAVDAKLAKGEPLGALAGIPVGVKDNICTQGVRTTCASRMLENFVPPYDATVAAKLAAADAVTIGKCNMDEFAMGSSCETSWFHPTKNPRDPARVPGGSSGGSAAAVAAGEAVVSLGSDTGGSIRLPASYCGVVGLKPTYGSVSRYGLVAFASSLDQIGPFARSVGDAALLYTAICGHDPLDATSARHDYGDFAAGLSPTVKGLRIGIPKEYFSVGVSGEVRERVMDAAKRLEAEGADLREVSLPSTDYALSAYYILSSAEASSNLARFDGVKYGYRAEGFESLTELYEKTRSEGFGDEVKRRILLGTFVLSSGYYDAYYKRAKLLQKRIQSEFEAAFRSCDLLLAPTATEPAFRFGEKADDPVAMYANDICTVTVNIAGLPAISVPCGEVGGMPVGLQLIGPKFSEQRLFDAAACWESLAGGWNAVPKLA